jgi:predicted RNA-binding protein with TRAM domain
MQKVRKNFGPVPVKEGEIHELEILSIGEKGDGIAKVEGFVIVVPEAKLGKRYNVEITAVRGRVGFGKALSRIKDG